LSSRFVSTFLNEKAAAPQRRPSHAGSGELLGGSPPPGYVEAELI
jgi:hypothetical protein